MVTTRRIEPFPAQGVHGRIFVLTRCRSFVYLLLLDAYHAGDLLFFQALARALARADRPPTLVVHGGGEHTERLFEAEGRFPAVEEGRLRPADAAERALLERGLREANRTLVAKLTDEMVYAVGVHGADRGLLTLGPDGTLRTGRTGWVAELAARGAVPVCSSLAVRSEGGIEELPLDRAARALAEALRGAAGGAEVACVALTRTHRPGITGADGEVLATCPPEAVPPQQLGDPELVRRLAASGEEPLVTSLEGLFGAGQPRGTWVT